MSRRDRIFWSEPHDPNRPRPQQIYTDVEPDAEPAEAPPLKVGAVVWLNSGGAAMTVLSAACCGSVQAGYFCPHGSLHEIDLPRECVTTIDPNQPEIPF